MCLFVSVYHGRDIPAYIKIDILLVVYKFWLRYVMTSKMVSHILIWQYQSVVPRNRDLSSSPWSRRGHHAPPKGSLGVV